MRQEDANQPEMMTIIIIVLIVIIVLLLILITALIVYCCKRYVCIVYTLGYFLMIFLQNETNPCRVFDIVFLEKGKSAKEREMTGLHSKTVI